MLRWSESNDLFKSLATRSRNKSLLVSTTGQRKSSRLWGSTKIMRRRSVIFMKLTEFRDARWTTGLGRISWLCKRSRWWSISQTRIVGWLKRNAKTKWLRESEKMSKKKGLLPQITSHCNLDLLDEMLLFYFIMSAQNLKQLYLA